MELTQKNKKNLGISDFTRIALNSKKEFKKRVIFSKKTQIIWFSPNI